MPSISELSRFIEEIAFIIPILIVLMLLRWLFDIRVKYWRRYWEKVSHILQRLCTSRLNSKKQK
jgi:hypothetical protein